MTKAPKQVDIAGYKGWTGISFRRTGNMKKGTARIEAMLWYDTYVGSEIPFTERDRQDLIALLQSGKGTGSDE